VTIRTEGEDRPVVNRGASRRKEALRLRNVPAAIAGISEVQAILDQLELQIAEYREILAAEGASASFDEQASTQADTAVSHIAEVEATADVEPASLESPAVELPELFTELQSQLEMGLHTAASVSIYLDGQELTRYLSSRDGSGVTPSPQPLFRAFSSGKAMTAATVWRLLDAGVIEIDAPVARYWPEFLQRGKSKVTVRHVLTHTAGLPRDFGRGDVDWGDWGRMSDILASLPLEYEPGKVVHYHAITFGILVAEIASRATGMDFVDLFEREVKRPLGLSDTGFSIDEDDRKTRRRVQRLTTSADYHDRSMPYKMDWLLDNQIVSPGATCVTTACDLAKLYSSVCNGGLADDEEVWLSAGAAEKVYEVHASAYDIESMLPARIGQGVWRFDDQPNPTATPIGSETFGHGGMGTSIAWGDPDYNVGIAIITDTMQEEEVNSRRLNRLSAAIRRDLGLPTGALAEL
jgi:CubicO group peptidase (beta-lactamase class C family)